MITVVHLLASVYRDIHLFFYKTKWLIDRLHDVNHVNCSDIFKCEEYKGNDTIRNINSVAVEQINAIYQRVEKSLRQMNYYYYEGTHLVLCTLPSSPTHSTLKSHTVFPIALAIFYFIFIPEHFPPHHTLIYSPICAHIY